jgi:hypothetical protein
MRNGRAHREAYAKQYWLAEGRIAHAEASSHVLGEKFDRATIRDWIGLSQILHGLDQKPLSVYVPGISRAFTSFPVQIRSNGDGKNFRHADDIPSKTLGQYSVTCNVFQPETVSCVL